MGNVFNKGLSFFGLADPEDIEQEEVSDISAQDVPETDFDRDDSFSMQSARIAQAGRATSTSDESHHNYSSSYVQRGGKCGSFIARWNTSRAQSDWGSR